MSPRRHRSYAGAHAVSVVFKIVAFLILIGGAGAAIEVHRDVSEFYTGSNTNGLTFVIIAGTVITASAVAFFAYVLDLLIGIEKNTFPDGTLRAVDVPRPVAPTQAVSSPPPMVTTPPQVAPRPPQVFSPPVQAPAPQTPPPQAQTGQQPGWYPDPQGVYRVRFWDGQRWTDRTQS